MIRQQEFLLMIIIVRVLQILIVAALIIILAALLPGCKKHYDKKTVCRISEVNPAGLTMGYHLLYNSNGKLSKAIIGARDFTYEYSGDTVIATILDSGRFSSKMIISLNTMGLATNVRTVYDLAGTNWSNDLYEYNGEELSWSTQTTSGGSSPSTSTYTWLNHNMRSIISGSQVTILNYYTDKPFQPGDYLYIYQVLAQGYEIYRNKNLLRSISGTNFNYEFNRDGNISGLTAINGAIISTLAYGYECN